MKLTSFVQDRQLTVALTGEIDHHTARQIMEAISEKIDVYLPLRCVLDFQEVTFMDSSGIAIVINALRNMKKLNGQLQLAGLHNQPMKVLKASGIDQLVTIKEVSYEI